MNPSTRAFASYCLTRGHTPIAIHNGFPGLVRHHADSPVGSVHEISFLESDPWVNLGGSLIGTNRSLPSQHSLSTIASLFAKYRFDALLLIGDNSAYTSLLELRAARPQHPEFNIPLLLLPASISNAVPGTEYSLGTDTCLNALITFTDTLRLSASSSRRVVSVIETLASPTGFITTLAGLSTGASCIYTPESGISFPLLASDINFLSESFASDHGAARSGKVILRTQNASKTYTTQFIADLINEEAHGRFEAYPAIPGYFSQGDKPSPIDRVRALRMAIECVRFIEGFAGSSPDEVARDGKNASVLGIKGSEMKFTPVAELEKEEVGKVKGKEFWYPIGETVDILSGRSRAATAGVSP
jgi:6-phosphofructokinase 1